MGISFDVEQLAKKISIHRHLNYDQLSRDEQDDFKAEAAVQQLRGNADPGTAGLEDADSKEKKRLLTLTPLHLQVTKQQREEILCEVQIFSCEQLSQSKLVEAGLKSEALYMLVQGTCTIRMSLKDGQTIELQRSAGEWFPYAMALDTVTPFDLVASPGSKYLVLHGAKRFKRIIWPVIKAATEMYLRALTTVFKDLPRYEAVRLLSIGSIYDARNEQVAIREGFMSSNLVVMVRGTCVITKEGSRLSQVASPHIFGQVSISHDLPNPVTVTTTSVAEFILFPKRELMLLLQTVAGLRSVAQRLEFDVSVGTRWLFQRSKVHLFLLYFDGWIISFITTLCKKRMMSCYPPRTTCLTLFVLYLLSSLFQVSNDEKLAPHPFFVYHLSSLVVTR
jgi:CRP-like cAMP-binding protein